MKYVGMTSRDPYLRKQGQENKGRFVLNFTVIKKGLTYDKAMELENKYKIMDYEEVESGGTKVPGPVYSVYEY